MRKIFVILILSLGLQGCLAGAFVAGSATTGGLVTDPRPLSTIKEDEEINFRVTKQLADDSELNATSHVAAVSYNKVVLLTGQAFNEELKAKAEHDAKSTPHVRRVFNEIAINVPIPVYRRAQDVGITSAVKTKMFANRELKSNNFKIVTEDGVVYILGIATAKQADLAVSIARDTSGVKKVVKLIEYKQE
jgi:osmotically-inducible protein OsmY